MTRRTRPAPAGVAASLVVCMLLACSFDARGDDEDTNQVRADVIECEDAIARLERCCPGFDGTEVRCQYYHRSGSDCGGGFSTQTTTPALSKEESKCIRTTSCDDLVTKKVCERAQKARETIDRTTTDHSTSTSSSGSWSPSATTHVVTGKHPPVCP